MEQKKTSYHSYQMYVLAIVVIVTAGFAAVWAPDGLRSVYLQNIFPLKSITAKAALKQIDGQPGPHYLTYENDGYWYVDATNQHKSRLKDSFAKLGWSYDTQEGNGYFFSKDGETTIATCKQWTRKYVLCKASIDLLE